MIYGRGFWVATSVRIAGNDCWPLDLYWYEMSQREVDLMVRYGFHMLSRFNESGKVLWRPAQWTPRAGAWVLDI